MIYLQVFLDQNLILLQLINESCSFLIIKTVCLLRGDFLGYSRTVKDNPQLIDLKGPGTSKWDWRYFEHNKVDRNELHICRNLHKGTGTKMTYFFLSNCSIFQSFLFLCLYANFCEPGVHSYQLYCVQSTSSPILKSLVP